MSWLQISFEVHPETVEELSDLLSQAGAVAVSLSDPGDEPLYEPLPGEMPVWPVTRVTGLFPAGIPVKHITDAVAGQLSSPLPHWHVADLEDQDWQQAYRDHFQPQQFGGTLWVCPSWCPPPQPDACNIILDPGLAFGTGHHPTTALCLEWLAHRTRYPDTCVADTVIDYGCGSGILAIAAAKLGATDVHAVDIDPQALQATTQNARLNRVEERIHACLPDELPPQPVQLLMANILSGILMKLAPTFAGRVQAGGMLLLSGILEDQAAGVIEFYRRWFDVDTTMTREGWVCLSAARNDALP
jgi:ribosomal protein L11 methyltransferase